MPYSLLVCWILVVGGGLLLVYPFLLYPMFLLLIPYRARPRRLPDDLPPVHVLLAAFNEAAVLRQKLDNTLALDYPLDRLTIWVLSDASTDTTDGIAAEFADRRVRLVRQAERGGKQRALNAGIAAVQAELASAPAADRANAVLLFTDAAAFLEPPALKELLANFADPAVGAVSGVIRMSDTPETVSASASAQSGVAPEGVYLGLDLWTRQQESRRGGTIGCVGAAYAARAGCVRPFGASWASDFASALQAKQAGLATILEPRAVAWMKAARSHQGEFRRKVRTIVGGLETAWQLGSFWSLGDPLFRWKVFSHKIARWLGPPTALVTLLAAAVGGLFGDPLLAVLAASGVAACAIGLAGLAWPGLRRALLPIRLATFALIAGWAGVVAWLHFCRGQSFATWQPTAR